MVTATAPLTSRAVPRPMSPEEKKVIFASSLGTVFEWYDFYLYGSLAAIIAKQFFSGLDAGAAFIFALLAFAAGLAGALAVSAIPTQALRYILPVLLIGVALFFALKPGLGDLDRTERLRPALFTLTAVPLIAFYDGLLGPGAGAFYMIAFVTLAGHGILRATAHTKLLNFASNAGGLTGFAMTGHPLWLLGLAMAAGQVLGAALGARLAVRIGARLIKPLLVVTSTLLALRLLWDLV